MVLSRIFSKSEYATFRQSLLVFTCVAPLLGLGLEKSVLYFIPQDPAKARRIFINVVVGTLATGVLFAIACILLGPHFLANQFNNPALRETIPWVGLFGIGMLLNAIAAPAMMALERVTWAAYWSLGSRLLTFAVVMLSLLVEATPVSAVRAMSLATFVVGLLSIGLIVSASHGQWELPSLIGIKELLKYAIPISVASVLEGLAMSLDRVLVSMLCTPEQFAVFSNGAMEIPFIGIITGAAMAVIMPDMVRAFTSGDVPTGHRLWCAASKKAALAIIPLGGLLFVLAPWLMVLLYSSAYAEAANPFRLYLLLLPARVMFFGAIFQAAGRTDIILWRACGTLILNVLVSYPLIVAFGISGAAIGTLIVFWGYVIPHCMYYSARILKIPIRSVLPLNHLLALLAITGLSIVGAFGITKIVPSVGVYQAFLAAFTYTLLCSAMLTAIVGPKQILATVKTICAR
ncbi:Polysaccharide biosynthesis protein [Aureliella helgolandensis]|uniref:Polysaccharide biosynthesis protein n=2 Tax=Aureliella helgolandensis TaxID=2527968 RepID=A0A518GC15_9BACT|nr:Polysaccharide biosynthesis protein [Aureliella helgolandensis]